MNSTNTPIEKIRKILLTFIAICLGMILWYCISLVVAVSDYSFDGEYIGDTRFGIYENKVYFSVGIRTEDLIDMLLFKNTNHLEVVGADPNSFKPFDADNSSCVIGADKNSVFWQTEKLEGIDVNAAFYLGSSYIKDDNNVFYDNKKIDKADANSFFLLQNAKSYYTEEYIHFAKDKQKVYYEHKALPKLNPNYIKRVEGTMEFVKDKSYVFYQDKELKAANPIDFKVCAIRYNVFYGTDGKNHFMNAIAFPQEIDNKKVDKKNLHVLQSPRHDMRTLLFSDKKRVYCYNELEEIFFSLDIPNLIHFKDGLFTDGTHIFYTEIEFPRAIKQNNITGRKTKIYKSEIEIKNLNVHYENEDMTVYQYKNKYYVYLNRNPSGGQSIFREVININNIQPIITRDNIREISNKELVKKIFQKFN